MKKELIAQRNPKSPVAETFRTLRTNIQFMNTKKNLKTILVTSTMPGEGKSWVSANLATTFAQSGKNVLIIDADMRRGRQEKIFSLESCSGLSNYLLAASENAEVDVFKYIKKTEVGNLYLMQKGSVPPNPSELLTSQTTIDMIEKVKQSFDIIIFDGTPSLIVTDAMIVARIVDTTIIVTEHNTTKKENLIKVKKSLEAVGASIAGVVINKIPINVKKYENTYYYSSATDNNIKKVESNRNKEKEKYDNESKVVKQIEEYFSNREKED